MAAYNTYNLPVNKCLYYFSQEIIRYLMLDYESIGLTNENVMSLFGCLLKKEPEKKILVCIQVLLFCY